MAGAEGWAVESAAGRAKVSRVVAKVLAKVVVLEVAPLEAMGVVGTGGEERKALVGAEGREVALVAVKARAPRVDAKVATMVAVLMAVASVLEGYMEVREQLVDGRDRGKMAVEETRAEERCCTQGNHHSL